MMFFHLCITVGLMLKQQLPITNICFLMVLSSGPVAINGVQIANANSLWIIHVASN